jgi:RNA polymerase sigma factor (sigma-70 family)
LVERVPLVPPDVASDAELVLLFDCLQSYLPRVRGMLRRMGFNPFVIQDAIDKTESHAVDAICSGHAASMTLPARRRWLKTVAFHAAASLVRRNRLVPLPDEMPSNSAPGLNEQQRGAVLSAVSTLPDDFRAAVQAVYFDGLSNRAAGRRLGVPEATFRRLLRRGLSHLLAAVQGQCDPF